MEFISPHTGSYPIIQIRLIGDFGGKDAAVINC